VEELMDRKEWDALKASGKLVELIPRDLRGRTIEGFSWFNLLGVKGDRTMNGDLARMIRRQAFEQLGRPMTEVRQA
jgi:hypothetical protein